MSQTMEQTDVGSVRESEEPEKKQKSRRPPSTWIIIERGWTCAGAEGDADDTAQTRPFDNSD